MVSEAQHLDRAVSDVTSGYAAFRPPRRVTVAQGAHDALHIKQPGGYTGPWSPEETPYMVEPMNLLASRRHEAVCFVGPARTGKTMGLLDGWMAHCVVNDPGDLLIVQMTQEKAREYSKTRVDRAIRHSPALGALMSKSRHDDNTHDKLFRHGMWLRIGWPTVSQLSSSDYRYVGLTDYDRMPDDVDGEGSAFGLALKRTQTFMSRGMCMVESSPGRPWADPNWSAATAHEAPPASGILGIYNRSDRRRWYWRCLDCSNWFEAAPGLALFGLPDVDELIELVREADLDALASKHSSVICPHCDSRIASRHKHELNAGGMWVPDGMAIEDGGLVGEPLVSPIAGYWLGGVAATYQSWKSLVMRYLLGLREYALTGSELTLQNTVNTDQGMPYMSRLLVESARNTKGPEDRQDATLQRFIVPDETRFIVAAVDVQGGANARFVVQVHAIGPHLEQWIVDRYSITKSTREGMGDEFAPIDPASYAEDWDQITERVVRSTYRTSIENRELRVKLTVVDSGGEDGVTDKAYDWYRRLRRERMHARVMLVKGASTKTAPIIKESRVGNRHGKEKGDIPLYMLNPNLLKDAVSTGLKRGNPGPGYIHLPAWPAKSFFDELQSEVRKANGVWMQIRKRNEAFDLAAYVRAGCLRLGADKIRDWDKAPKWAAALAANSEVMTVEDRREMKDNELIPEAAAELIAETKPVRPMRRRRATRSGYLA